MFSRSCAVALIVAIAGSLAAELRAAPPRRARPPKFSKSIEDAFFPDARQKLNGPRPAPAAGQSPAVAAPAPAAIPKTPATGRAWSKRISAEVVEDEIKFQHTKLAETVANPNEFKGGDYQQARAHLSMLAVMFAVVAEYDDKVRWQRQAAGMRDLVARAGFNCKVGTDASYKEAKARAEDLQLLVRGGSVPLPATAAQTPWSNVADRQPLMKRLEQAQQEAVAPWTASSLEFERHADRLAAEAQLIAVLAEVIAQEGYEFADDATYLEHARAMQSQALSLRDAALKQNYEEARKAGGELGKACSNCHEGYRS